MDKESVEDRLVGDGTIICINECKLILPRPVTGSHPSVAVNPATQWTGGRDTEDCAQQLLFPVTMSLKRFALAYKVGLIKPTVGSPSTDRFAFTRETA
jgi:hypothetical protein